MKTTLLAIALSAALLGGCGGGGSDTKDSSPAGQVKATILDWTFKQDKCPYMTDKFIKAQAFIGDTRAARCDFIKKTYQAPRYSKDAVKFRKIEVTPTTAIAGSGDDFSN